MSGGQERSDRGKSSGLRIVVGCDDAGYEYKEILKGDLLADDRVADVTDCLLYTSPSPRDRS